MDLKRHTLLDITDHGRDAILAELAGCGPESDMLRERYAQILLPKAAGARVPAIARREEGPLRPGFIPVGFSAPMIGREGRLRVAAFVREEDITRTTSPYELLVLLTAPPRNVCNRALASARVQAQALGLAIGVWGSAALELYTGLPCTHQDSDLDLLVAAAPREILYSFLYEIASIEAHLGLRIDVELELANGYGVHLKELFGRGLTVLGKSINDVVLLPRKQVLAELPQEESLHIRAVTGSKHGRATPR
jgi:phosphoribosyl-dephospho-CoA transferase